MKNLHPHLYTLPQTLEEKEKFKAIVEVNVNEITRLRNLIDEQKRKKREGTKVPLPPVKKLPEPTKIPLPRDANLVFKAPTISAVTKAPQERCLPAHVCILHSNANIILSD